MKKLIAVALAIIITFIMLASTIIPSNHANAKSNGSCITWSPAKLSTAVPAGGTQQTTVNFSSKKDLSNVTLSIVPELECFLSISPTSFPEVTKGTTYSIQLAVSVPSDEIPNSDYEGVLQLKVGKRVYPQSLKIRLHVSAPLETLSEEESNASTAKGTEAKVMFQELQESLGVDGATETVVSWLLEQDEVLDAGITLDGNIWVVFKIGISGVISTAPPGVLGSAIQQEQYVKPQDYEVANATITPTSKTAILLWPLFSQPLYQLPGGNNQTIVQIQKDLASKEYAVTAVKDGDVTVGLLKTIYQYGIVDFFTHGSMNQSGEISLMTGEQFIALLLHLPDFTNGRLELGFTDEGIYITILPSFIRHYAAQPYPNSLINVNACSSLKTLTLADAFLDNGAYVYCGWSRETIDIFPGDMYSYLSQGLSLGSTYTELQNDGKTTSVVDGITAHWWYYPSGRGDLKLEDDLWQFQLPTAQGLVVGDINSDGENELVLYGNNGSVNIYDFNGSSYISVLSSDIGSIAVGSNIADADGDGLPEIIASANLLGTDHVVVRVYSHNGTSYIEEGSMIIATVGSIHHIIIDDIDGDSNNEVVIAGYEDVRVYDYRDNAFTELWRYSNGINFWATTGDTDGDGVSEIVATINGGRLLVFSFDMAQQTYILDYETQGVGQWPWGITTWDANNDGKEEIVVGDDQGVVRIYRNDGQTYEMLWSTDIGTAAYPITVGDVNNDGVNDVAIAEWMANILGAEESDGSIYLITFDGAQYDKTEFWTMGEPVLSLAFGDTDNDGEDELLVGTVKLLTIFDLY